MVPDKHTDPRTPSHRYPELQPPGLPLLSVCCPPPPKALSPCSSLLWAASRPGQDPPAVLAIDLLGSQGQHTLCPQPVGGTQLTVGT
jgi:hypothetical protein